MGLIAVARSTFLLKDYEQAKNIQVRCTLNQINEIFSHLPSGEIEAAAHCNMKFLQIVWVIQQAKFNPTDNKNSDILHVIQKLKYIVLWAIKSYLYLDFQAIWFLDLQLKHIVLM